MAEIRFPEVTDLDPGNFRLSLLEFGITRLGERGYRVVRTRDVKCLARGWDAWHRYQVPGRAGGIELSWVASADPAGRLHVSR